MALQFCVCLGYCCPIVMLYTYDLGVDENDEGSHHMEVCGGRVGWVRILLISNTSMSCPRQPIHNLLILRCGEGFPNISLGGRRVLGCVV